MKKIVSLIIAFAMVSIIAVGTTLAYFTNTKTQDNVFTVGNVEIQLTENKWNATDAHQIIPGKEIAKDPTVKNIGANDAFVRLRVEIPNADKLLNDEYTINSFLVNTDDINWTIDTKTESNTCTVTLVYNNMLKPTDSAITAFTGVKFPETLKNGDLPSGYTIKVTADAIQEEGFKNADEAFVAFDKK